MSNNFKKASRIGLVFATPKGTLTVDMLWQLPLVSKSPTVFTLDVLAQQLQKAVKETVQTSFVNPTNKNSANAAIELSFEIVKEIIDDLLTERKEAEQEKSKADERQRLLELREKKLQAEDETLSVEEIDVKLAALK